MKKTNHRKDWRKYYEEAHILDEVLDEPTDLVLDESLREEILSGKRKRNLKNVTIKKCHNNGKLSRNWRKGQTIRQ